jgi:hypothetical protein
VSDSEPAPERRYVQPADFCSIDQSLVRLASEQSERCGNCLVIRIAACSNAGATPFTASPQPSAYPSVVGPTKGAPGPASQKADPAHMNPKRNLPPGNQLRGSGTMQPFNLAGRQISSSALFSFAP